MKTKTIIIIFVVLFALPQAKEAFAQNTAAWIIPLRDALYQGLLTPDQIRPIYQNSIEEARRRERGKELNLALSAIENFMGRSLLEAGRDSDARPHFAEGMRLAQEIVDSNPCARSWVLVAENLSYLCQIGPWTFTAANGLNVERFSRNALSFDSRNAKAQYLIAARWVFAPAPFHNLRRGIDLMTAILTDADTDAVNIFDVNTAIAQAHIRNRRPQDARAFVNRAAEIYPSNKFVLELRSQL